MRFRTGRRLCGVHARRSACIPKALRYIGTQRMLSRIDWSSMAENDAAVEIIRCTIAGASEASVRSSCMMNGLNVDDDVNKLRDRLMRFEIRTRFGDDKAMWDPVQDVASQMSAVTAASNNQAAVEGNTVSIIAK
ncbi:unnamed protein product [Trichogramma brassicae]|uniref:Uncharacterized protein n=1 Tax=Trichogramma brassicae TaxID=86971 RepID=A0A6H5I1Q3_9HYME|nr:unnamed protein product [Trichogramma brassicae]